MALDRFIPRVRGSVGFAAAALAAAGCLHGCASSVPRRSTGVPMGNQGAAWEVVLPGRGIGPFVAGAESPAADRRDASLNIRTNEPVLALGSWPEAPRASLDRRRTLHIPDRADEFLFFGERPAFHHPTHWWTWR